MHRNRIAFPLAFTLFAFAACTDQPPTSPHDQPSESAKSDPTDPVAVMRRMNERLRARGLRIAVEKIEFFTEGPGRPSNRIHQQDTRWVPNDERRLAQGNDLTYLIATNRSETSSGLTAQQTTGAIQRAFATWRADDALDKVELVERSYTRGDVSIYDDLWDAEAGTHYDDFPGRLGNYLAADIVNVGWLPRSYFELVGGPGGGRGILAFSVTFIWLDEAGNPSDIDGDNYLDAALNEVYYNDTFGDADTDRAGNPWAIDRPLPAIDVETVGLHENGHSLALGHFGPEPEAVMNPVYAGIRHEPYAADDAGLNAAFSSWPSP
jgi:hypothetical protein